MKVRAQAFEGRARSIIGSPILGAVAATTALLAGLMSSAHAQEQPNIVIIMADDVALMDFGAYGGEARTPHIDALAADGAVFTQFRASPLCSPSRAMLFTGLDNHMTGVATIPEVLPPEQKGQPGYTMALEPNVLTIGDRLRASGYRTLFSGKWHMGEKAEEMPQAHGFDRSFALAASGADNWEDRSYLPYYKDAPWFEDGVETSLPEDFYSSEFLVDKMIEYLEGSDASKPFLAVLPFQAIHIPVQAPQEFIDRYKGRYDAGWHALRTERYERAQELGLIPEGAPLGPMPENTRPWQSLSAKEQELYAARMEVNAAMLEAMDHHIGRFIDYLEAQGQFENTIFVVTSDNGPEYGRGDIPFDLVVWRKFNGYSIGMEGLGGPGSWGFIGPEWANAAASPSALYKFYASEGGVRTPLIIAGPGIEPSRIASPAMITDIAPTLLEMVDAAPAPSSAKVMTGRSLLSVLRGEEESAYGPDDVRAIEVSGNSALYKGDYKITRSMPPIGDGEWRLFDFARDPGETTDLREVYPEILSELIDEFETYSDNVGLIPVPEGYDTMKAVHANAMERINSHYPVTMTVINLLRLLIVGLGLWFGGRFVYKHIKRMI